MKQQKRMGLAEPWWSFSTARQERLMTPLAITLVLVLLARLPLAAWLDLRTLSEQSLRRQVTDLSRAVNAVRDFYANEIVQRVVDAKGQSISVTNDYQFHAGAIPIPATFSIELGKVVGAAGGGLEYRFVSDHPFTGRGSHNLDGFERNALETFRHSHGTSLVEVTGSIFDSTVRLATPVVMSAACVSCHATHPDSLERDWKVGDVRGIQSLTVHQSIQANIFAFKYLLAYFALAAALGGVSIALRHHLGKIIQGLNEELATANDFLAGISMKISKYLSPQVYKSPFSGLKDMTITTERKKLTIFFSDIKDFTATTERMQPEDLTALLHEYLTEMSRIALVHGGTVDKFIGDAILVFFGDPETKGVEEDARAGLRMAVEMQRLLLQLEAVWRQRGIEVPFRARMGINTSYCNVENFGSADRMDYTIIGAEANLAARLQTAAEPGKIVLSYETYALVGDMVSARALEPISMKGINRKMIPYMVDEFQCEGGEIANPTVVINERLTGVSVFLDVEAIDKSKIDETRGILNKALDALAGLSIAQSPRRVRGAAPCFLVASTSSLSQGPVGETTRTAPSRIHRVCFGALRSTLEFPIFLFDALDRRGQGTIALAWRYFEHWDDL
jgi:class 3 adenylate cyclase